jgi:DNA-binding MarR family transcriptional regulator
MEHRPRSISAIGRLFELAARSLHSASFSEGLYPAQWSALRYLSTAGPTERTSAKLARFQQLAVGPVTRTVRTLVAKGLLTEGPAAGHHRSKQLNLTDAGLRLLESDPLIAVDLELKTLSPQEARIISAALGRIISALHVANTHGEEISLRLDSDQE